jgi:hypothetical protein
MITITKAIRAPTLTVSATMPMMIPAIVARWFGMRARRPASAARASGYGTPRITAVMPYTVPQITEMARLPSM